jgi:hypothetical protein
MRLLPVLARRYDGYRPRVGQRRQNPVRLWARRARLVARGRGKYGPGAHMYSRLATVSKRNGQRGPDGAA